MITTLGTIMLIASLMGLALMILSMVIIAIDNMVNNKIRYFLINLFKEEDSDEL